MARNKITFEKEYGDDYRWTYRFIGSQRQPTPDEIEDFIEENNLQREIEDDFMVCAIKGKVAGGGYQGFLEEEKNTVVELWGYNGGSGDGSCPICGHERDMGLDVCPICLRKWAE
ncbi:MAG: hypothetical protein IKH16_13475 [Selenomonadaceae bacterium]|nr:hypothetical protein [Selenomonadaceae bacterium]